MTDTEVDAASSESAVVTGSRENETEKQAAPPDRSAIYVDESAPATLRYSETLVIYPTLREARDAWLALPPEIKKDALVTIQPNGARYHGWEVYRLWAR